MAKLGRNDPCHCGSGKKYKKCCLNKDDSQSYINKTVKMQFNHITYEEVNGMRTNEIIDKLAGFGIPFDEKDFLKDMMEAYSAEEISESWFNQYDVTTKGRDEDFPWIAAWILWERLGPDGHLSMEQMNDLLELGYDYAEKNNPIAACDVWLVLWEALKNRNSPLSQTLDFLDEKYRGSFFVSNFCQDLEIELFNAGKSDPVYFEKRIEYCREFCNVFPNERELIIHNMRRAIADSYGALGKDAEAEFEFKKLVDDFPRNPFSYVGFGDFYEEREEYLKARAIYEKGLVLSKGDSDIDVLEERLEALTKYFS